MKFYIYSILFILYIPFLYAQKKHSGVYEGIFWDNKCVASLKISNGAILGALYTGRSTYYNIFGTIENGRIKAILDHSTLGGGELDGYWRNDSITSNVVFEKMTVSLKLQKKSTNTFIDLNKYFGKPNLDAVLFGYWRLISQFNRKGEPIKPVHKGYFLDKKGSYTLDEIVKSDYSNADVIWYTSDQHLYTELRYKEQKQETDMGRYSVKNDTLLLVGVGMFAGSKAIYVRGK